MSYKLRFSPEAVRDIDAVLTAALEDFGSRQHEECKSLIRMALADIASDPDRHPASRRDEIHRNARTFHISRRGRKARHFFLYRINSGYVVVGRLLHDAMDFGRHLPEGFAVETKKP